MFTERLQNVSRRSGDYFSLKVWIVLPRNLSHDLLYIKALIRQEVVMYTIHPCFFFLLTGRRYSGGVWYYCSTLSQFLITSKCTYPRSPPLLIWYKLVSLYTERHSIGLHKLISIVASLSTDSLHA